MITPDTHSQTRQSLSRYALITGCLILAIWAVYWQTGSYGFINFDDNTYVTENKRVQQGVTLENLKWVFKVSKKDDAYWHPLTWLSHMLDCQLFGLDAGRHHLTNLILHTANSLLVLLVIWKLFGTFEAGFCGRPVCPAPGQC